MRSFTFRSLEAAALASLLLATSYARADEPAPTEPLPAASQPPQPAPAAPLPSDAPPPVPASSAPAAPPPAGADTPADGQPSDGLPSRAEGMRLGLDLGVMRAFSGNDDRLNAGSPTVLPIGIDVSFRTSKTFAAGFDAYAGLASRDDCISSDSCRARAYRIGGHVEGMLARGASYLTYLRYGMGFEVLYQGGRVLDPSGHVYRNAFDLLDLRFGADFTVSRGSEGRTVRIGPYLGLVGGFLVSQSGVSNIAGSTRQRDLSRDSGSPHLWFTAGVRANFDP